MPPTLFRNRLINWLQGALILAGLGGLYVLIGYLLAGPTGVVWGLVLAAVLAVLGPGFSREWVLRLYHAVPVAPHQAPELRRMVENLARAAELPQTPQLYYVPSEIPNAFAVGGPGNAAVAVSEGLLRGLSERELAGVLAHELSHVRNKDTWVMSLADGFSRMVGALSLFGQILLLINLPLALAQGRHFPWIPLLLLALSPTFSALLQLALSRNREYQADLAAVQLTGDPLGLASALRKLESWQERRWPQWVWPGRKNRQPSLLRTHPETEARVAKLLELAEAHHPAHEDEPPRPPELAMLQRVRAPRHHWHGLWY